MDKTTNIYTALLQAQKDMEPVRKDGRGNYGAYATLDGVISTVTETLNKNGILVTQPLGIDDGHQVIHTQLIHASSGETYDGFYKVVCKDMDDPQKIGGAITYGRRYSLLAILGLAPEDDDATAASTPASRPTVASSPTTAPQKSFDELPDAKDGDEACEYPGCDETQTADFARTCKAKFGKVYCRKHWGMAKKGELEVPDPQSTLDAAQGLDDELESLFGKEDR